VPEFLRTPDAEDALSLSEYGPAIGQQTTRAADVRQAWDVLRREAAT
jgi:hypothetical protein